MPICVTSHKASYQLTLRMRSFRLAPLGLLVFPLYFALMGTGASIFLVASYAFNIRVFVDNR